MKPVPRGLEDEVRRRRNEAQDEDLREAIRSDLFRRLSDVYELYTEATVMPDRRTGRLHLTLNFCITYDQAERLSP